MSDDSIERFYTWPQVLLASLFGGMPAGLYLYRANAKLLDKEKEGNLLLALGIGATLVGMAVAFWATGPFSTNLARAFGPISVILPVYMARQFQREPIRQRFADRSQKMPTLKAFGIGVASLGIFLALGIALAFIIPA